MPAPDPDIVLREIRKIPPVTRFALASTVGCTMLVILNRARYRDLMYTYEEVFENNKVCSTASQRYLG